MKKIVSFLAACCLLIAAARFANMPNEAQAELVAEEYRETIRKGLDYLASKQFDDGHWEADGGAHPVAMTGLAGLALLMEGIDGTASKEKHAEKVRKATDWLIEQSRPGRDGLIFSDHPSESSRYMQGHGLATLFLAGVRQWAPADSRDKKIAAVLSRAVKYILSAQSTQGGWHDTSKAEGHDFATIGATVIQIQALVAASDAGIAVPNEAIRDGHAYLRASLENVDQETNLHIRLAETAGILAVDGQGRFGFGNLQELKETADAKERLREKARDFCRSKLAIGSELKFGSDELAHYYYAQSTYVVGGDAWGTYRKAVFDQLRNTQRKDGSWPAGSGTCVGPVYAAAVWCTILQLDGNKHPVARRIERAVR